jgi:DNA invertase Pin-like site-specific DNA recombinase
MTDNITKALIYCRVSDTKKKIEGSDLESQEVRCRQHAASKDTKTCNDTATTKALRKGKHHDR